MAKEQQPKAEQPARKQKKTFPALGKIERALVEFMRPTQGAVGFLEVELKMAELMERSRQPKILEKYLAGHPIPAALGPDGRMYLTDHHHMGLALQRLSDLWEAGDGGAGENPFRSCCFGVHRDYSEQPSMSLKEFYKALEAEGLCHPFGGEGQRIERLPTSLSQLVDDPYRSLSGLARKAGAYDKTDEAYLEFKWANYFRDKIPLSTLNIEQLPEAIHRAIELASAPAAAALPGHKVPPTPYDQIPGLAEIAMRLARRHGADDMSPDLPELDARRARRPASA